MLRRDRSRDPIVGAVVMTMRKSAWLCLLLASCAPAPPAATTPATVTTPPAAATAPPPPAPAVLEAPEPKDAEPETSLVEPCHPDDPRYQAADEALDALDKRVDALAKTDDPKDLARAIRKVASQPCLAWANRHFPHRLREVDSGWALKDWWERGGEWWLRHYLELGGPPDQHFGHTVSFPADPRPTLTRQSRPGHPLRHLICDQDDEACHEAPKGFRKRAEAWLSLDAERRRAERLPPDTGQPCLEAALDMPVADQFAEWYACLVERNLRERMFPLGGLRVPEDGWLVVQGRRGHYGFCDEIRAYDLKSGAFYATQSCGGLALRRNGSVDQDATDAARKPRQIVGRIPVLALREAAWMILVADELSEAGVDRPGGRSIPEELRIGWPADSDRSFTLFGRRYGMSSNQTTLAWRYQRGGKRLHTGELRWPNDYNHAGKDHAVKLLQIAEAQLEEGCAPARLPKLVMGGSQPGVSPIDATPQSLDAAQRALLDALQELRRTAKRCR